jgi:hypothetical protein
MNTLRLGQATFDCHIASIEPDNVAWKVLSYVHEGQTWQVELPHLSPDQLTLVAQRLRLHGARLKARPVSELVSAIDQAANALLDPKNPIRKSLDNWLPRVTGMDAELLRLCTTACLKTFRGPQLQRFLTEDFANPVMLDAFQPRPIGGMTRVMGPDLLFQVWAGNVPGLPLWGLVSGLLVKAPIIGKVSTAEPVMAHLFAEALFSAAPWLAHHLALVWFQGGDAARERVLCEAADVVLAYGNNESLTALRASVPVTTRFLPHGHKISLGMVSAAALDVTDAPQVAQELAWDVVRYEQMGCYSPQCVYVERGGRVSPGEFSGLLAHALSALQHKFASSPLSLQAAAQQASWRHLQQFSSEAEVLTGDAPNPWAVQYRETPTALKPAALSRLMQVHAVNQLQDAIPHLAAAARWIQTLGLAVSPQELLALQDPLALAGITRICALGGMTNPPPGWHHDGRFSLLDLVRMVDLEPSAESAAERFAPYRD